MRRPPIDERLAAIPLFAGLDARQLTCVASLATPIDVGAGRELIREGQTGREFFLVIEGEAGRASTSRRSARARSSARPPCSWIDPATPR